MTSPIRNENSSSEDEISPPSGDPPVTSAQAESTPQDPAAAAAVVPRKLDDTAYQYLVDALATPSPSGFEEPIQRLNRRYLSDVDAAVRIDMHGNLIATTGPAADDDQSNGQSATAKLMYAGHCDQIGMLVTYIDDNGFVYAQTIGGWDPQQLIGQAMMIWTDRHHEGSASGSGDPIGIPAVISRKPIHLLSMKERGRVVDLDELWLDIGAADAADAKTQVRVGDPVTLDLRMRPLTGNKISGPGMDNKAGMWTVIEALRRAATSEKKLACQLHSVATVQEEIGLRGAKTAAGSINPDLAIAVDVTHASDCPTIDKNRQGDIRVGAGPVIYRGPNINRRIADRLVEIAKNNDMPYQIAAIARATPNDANALQIHGRGVGVGLVAIPNRYMHSAVEVISTADIDVAADLLAQFALSVTDVAEFIPGG